MSSILLNSKYTSVNFPCRQVTNGYVDLRSYLTQAKTKDMSEVFNSGKKDLGLYLYLFIPGPIVSSLVKSFIVLTHVYYNVLEFVFRICFYYSLV